MASPAGSKGGIRDKKFRKRLRKLRGRPASMKSRAPRKKKKD